MVQLPEELRGVPRLLLEEYVQQRVKEFAQAFAPLINPAAQLYHVEQAWAQATQQLAAQNQTTGAAGGALDNCILRFEHHCKFLGCQMKDCLLCKNNPSKCCQDVHFDEAYADGQALRSKCEADVRLELRSLVDNQLITNIPGLEVQLFVIDGESWSESQPANHNRIRRLLKSDEGQTLLTTGVAGSKPDSHGYLYLKLQEGAVKLPDVAITDKNDTFHMNGSTFTSFRVEARLITRDLQGTPVPVESIPPAFSSKFVVKTQRALNDYRKCEFPHYRDELTKLKFIGSITAQRLREIQTHLGPEVPFSSVETVEQLKQLMMYADQHRQVESKLLEMLNMKGKHKQKWEYLRDVLSSRIVYDDTLHRVWYADDGMTQGLLFTCKQGQVNMEKPMGVFKRVQQPTGAIGLQVFTNPDSQVAEKIREWRGQAEVAWTQPGHTRWAIAQERVEVINTPGPALMMLSPSTSTQQLALQRSSTMPPSAMSPANSGAQEQGMEDVPQPPAQMLGLHRHSTQSSPHMEMPDRPSSVHSSAHAIKVEQPTPRPLGHVMMPFGSLGAYKTSNGGAGPSSMPDMYSTMPRKQQDGGPGAMMLNPGVYHFSAGQQQSQGMMGSSMSQGGAQQTFMSNGDAGQQQDMFNMQSDGSDGRPARSSRYRRMSADAMNGSAHVTGHAGLMATHSSAEGFAHLANTDAGCLLKRPRSSAPSGLYTEDAAAAAAAAVLPDSHAMFGSVGGGQNTAQLDRARLNLYHLESQGRHLPRGRKSQENLAACSEPIPNNIMTMDGELDLDSMLLGMADGTSNYGGISNNRVDRSPTDQLLLSSMGMGHGSSGGGMNLSISGAPAPLSAPPHMNMMGHALHMQQQHLQAHGLAMSGQPLQSSLSWQQHELTNNLHNSLNLGDHNRVNNGQTLHLGQQSFAGLNTLALGPMSLSGMESLTSDLHTNAGVLSGRQPMLMMPESDSFKQSLNRMWGSDAGAAKEAMDAAFQVQLGSVIGSVPGRVSNGGM